MADTEEPQEDPVMAEKRRRIREIEADPNLTAAEKNQKKMEVLTGRAAAPVPSPAAAAGKSKVKTEDVVDEHLKCAFCFEVCERPVTAPCQHNFCLACFNKWVREGKKTCVKCRKELPAAMRNNPRINSLLVKLIRMARRGEQQPSAAYEATRIANAERPDEAFTTERAVKPGKANAASGRIFVTIPPDHFGPITAEYDPEKNRGVVVGDYWPDRLACRQWGAHFPHVAGIAGQSSVGAQSVALSGGYEDDEDNGEWFLYTGSGGRDLSGNKRTNKEQSFDQVFEAGNAALRTSCQHGYPVRVVRSHKEKRSSYAPAAEEGVRYDGVYRIEKVWRKPGQQGKLVCRYLFVRCDNAAAPWLTTDEGDKPRPLPELKELEDKGVKDLYERPANAKPAWDYDEGTKTWGWTREPPVSQKMTGAGPRKRRTEDLQKKLTKEFGCRLCKGVLSEPLTMPCGHTFCKACLDKRYGDQSDTRERAAGDSSGRSMRVQKVVKPCPDPGCKKDICEFLRTAQVNVEMAEIIKSLQRKAEEAALAAEEGADNEAGEDEEEEEEEEDGLPSTSAGAKGKGKGKGKVKAEASPAPAAAAAAGGSAKSPAKTPAKSPVAAAAAAGAAAAAAAAAKAKENAAVAERAAKTEALIQEFPEIDRALIEGMMEDQGGEMHDVRFFLKKMRKDMKADEKKKAAAEAGGEAGAGAGAGKSPSKTPLTGKKRGRVVDGGGEEEGGEGAAKKTPGKKQKTPGGKKAGGSAAASPAAAAEGGSAE